MKQNTPDAIFEAGRHHATIGSGLKAWMEGTNGDFCNALRQILSTLNTQAYAVSERFELGEVEDIQPSQTRGTEQALIDAVLSAYGRSITLKQMAIARVESSPTVVPVRTFDGDHPISPEAILGD